VDEEKYHLEMWGENSLLTWGGPLRKEFLRCDNSIKEKK